MFSKYKYNKRGNMIIDSLFFLVIMFVFVLIIFYGKIVSEEVNSDIQGNDDVSDLGKSVTDDINNNYGSLFDSVIILCLVLFWVLTLAFSFLIDSNPIFFIVSFVLLVGVLITSAYIGNVYEEIVADDTLSGVVNYFPMTNFVFTHLLLFIICISLSIGVALYAKTN